MSSPSETTLFPDVMFEHVTGDGATEQVRLVAEHIHSEEPSNNRDALVEEIRTVPEAARGELFELLRLEEIWAPR